MTPSYVILEGFLPETVEKDIENIFISDIPWYYNKGTVGFSNLMNNDFGNPDIRETYQFNHPVLVDNRSMTSEKVFRSVMSVLDHLSFALEKRLIKTGRVKANLLLPNDWKEGQYHPPHYDAIEPDALSFAYYVNDSDGDFRLFDRTITSRFSSREDVLEAYKDMDCLLKIKPKRGTGILFPSNLMHCGSGPIESDRRIMINYVLAFSPVD